MDEERLYRKLRGQFFISTIKEERRQNQLFAPLNINYDTFRCLYYLKEHSEGVEPSRMSDDLLILRQTTTYIVDKLQNRGLVERISHPADRRRILIRLLPTGEDIADKAIALSKEYHHRIMQHFTEEQLESYIALRTQMADVRSQVLDEMLKERKQKENE